MSKILGIIPARFASTRFPGKPLADILGKSMIQRVYEQATKSTRLHKVVVATDDERIKNHVKTFAHAIMTKPEHPTGTDRCKEALALLGESYDYVINIQGDEPMIDPIQIDQLADLLDNKVELATLAKKINDAGQLENPNVVKVVTNQDGFAMYFSRSVIPFIRNNSIKEKTQQFDFLKHIGIYGYRSDTLHDITQLKPGMLERAESLEQLRWLENGYQIKVGLTEIENIGVDTPEDLNKIVEKLKP